MTAPTTATTSSRTWIVFRHRLREDVAGMPWIWGMFVLAVAAVIALVAIFRADGIEISGWEQASRVARWYTGAIGIYFTSAYLPLYVTHGITRREFMAQLPALTAAFAGMYALLMTVGFGLESVVYRWFGWPHILNDHHLFDGLSQVGLVLLEFFLMGMVWTVAGAILGAGFYRSNAIGLALVPVALAMVGLAETAVGTGYLGPIGGDAPLGPAWLTDLSASPLWATLIAAALAVAGLTLVRALVRNIPIRNPS